MIRRYIRAGVLNAALGFLLSCGTSLKYRKYASYDNEFLDQKIQKYFNTDKDHESFVKLSFELINDLKQQAISSLNNKNSSRALKYSSLAVRLFPYRADLVAINSTAIKAFTHTTQEMVRKKASCGTILNRQQLLSEIAPDVIPLRSKHCRTGERKLVSRMTDLSLLKFDETTLPRPMKEPFSFESELNEILRKNNSFPENEFISLLYSYVGLFAHSYRRVYDYSIHPETRRESRITFCPRKEELIEVDETEAEFKFCENIQKVLQVEGGQQFIGCVPGKQQHTLKVPTTYNFKERFFLFFRNGGINYQVRKYVVRFKDGTAKSQHEILFGRSVEYVKSQLPGIYSTTLKCQKHLTLEEARNLASVEVRPASELTIALNLGIMNFYQNKSEKSYSDNVYDFIEAWALKQGFKKFDPLN